MLTTSRPRPTILLSVALLAATLPAHAWTPASQQRIAEMAARLAPPDLHRQLARHRAAFLQGILDPFREAEPAHHYANGDGSGRLDQAIAQAVDNAIAAIRAHQPFEEVAYRAGIVSHYLADANNPLNSDESDRDEGRYFADFLRYLEHVEPRLKLVFYGFRGGFQGRRDLPGLIAETLERSRGLYPMVGREYRRVGFVSGVGAFDDLSTAYGVAALSYSHAISDIAEVLRYIWIEAGGIDTRVRIPLRGHHLMPLPRETEAR
ncbi:MAG: hypothetical protein V3T72_13055 [Thermoanaerobaculia bacterium]